MADGELKSGGVAGAGIGAIGGAIIVGALWLFSAPLSVPASIRVVVGVAAVGAVAGAATGK